MDLLRLATAGSVDDVLGPEGLTPSFGVRRNSRPQTATYGPGRG